MIKGALKLIGVIYIVIGLSACGGGGGGGGATTGSVSGTVTDSALLPVADATVTVQGGTATTTTDAAGRYSLSGLAGATTLTFTGPSGNFFPTAAKVTVVAGNTTPVDIFLARATDQTLPAAEGGGITTSDAFIGAGQTSTFALTAGELEISAGGAYSGTATVHVTPIDVGKPGHGLASYVTNLNLVFPAALTGAATPTIELFGAAAVEIEDLTGVPLILAAGSTSTLTLPIPASLPGPAPLTADLWYYDEVAGALAKDATTATLDVGGTFYTATVDRTGVWQAGNEALATDTVTGTLLFSNGSAVKGAAIYAIGEDHGYTNLTTTNASGAFSLGIKNGGTVSLHSVVYARGAQWPYEIPGTISGALGNITLPYAPPASTGAATATITIDGNAVPAARVAPDQLGYIIAGGRQIGDDANAAINRADITFLAVPSPGIPFGEVSLTPTQSGCGVQEVAGTFASLTTAPVGGYFADDGINPASSWTIADLETATLPILVAVEIPDHTNPPNGKHYAKISIDSVQRINPLGTIWEVTFRHAFSLTGTF